MYFNFPILISSVGMRKESTIEDRKLLEQIKNDDVYALKTLFAKYYSPLCFFAFQFVKNSDISEEVVSDVFLNIWLKRGKIEITYTLRSYLYTAVRNTSLNYLKQNHLHFDEIELIEEFKTISNISADEQIVISDLQEGIENLISKLPKKRQIIFRMNRLDGLSYKEIAEILNISINTVQNQMVKAAQFIALQYPHFKKFFSLLF